MFCKVNKAFSKLKGKKANNKGSSVIMVIVAVAFISMLVSAIVYMAYYNYLMKYNDRSAKNNFYTVETALDEVNMGLQRELSDVMAESYTYTSKFYDLSIDQKQSMFQDLILQKLVERLRFSSTDTVHYQVNKLTLYLDKTRYNSASGVGAVILTTDTDAILYQESNRLTLKNVYVQYTDERGYVSRIQTDIVIGFPDINFTTNKNVPDLENYCLIANRQLNTEPSTTTEVKGNVYGGNEGIFSANFSKLTFQAMDGANAVVTAKWITVEDGPETTNGFEIGSNTELWTDGIDVISSNISLGNIAHVSDDLTIDGKDSKVNISGKYIGYGNAIGNATGSSSIVINGANTSLDMSGAEEVFLLGHAFVGARHYNANSTAATDYVEDISTISANSTDVTPLNAEDLMLGQSVAVKSDQLMYMVPLECMGYQGNVQVLAKNPLTLAEHDMLTKTTVSATDPTLKYKVVNLNKVISKLGREASSYGVSYQPIYRKVNGTILVYYYLVFNSETMANKFFSDYFAADKEAMEAYIKEYVADFKWNSATPDLHLAGNLIYFNSAGEATLRPDTVADDVANIDDINDRVNTYTDTYEALSTKLLKDKTSISTDELSRTVFENIIVPDDEFEAIVPAGTTKEFANPSGGAASSVRAILVNNKNSSTFEITSSNATNLYLVIATGDVRVKVAEFKGLIIAGGDITISPSCIKIEPNAENVKKAMNCKDSSATHYAGDVLRDKDAYLNYSSVSENQTADENGYIDITKLIHYENWSKK